MIGLLFKLLRLLVKLVIFLVFLGVVITFCPGIPPNHVKFEGFTIKPALKLEGHLAPNSILNNVQVMKTDKELVQPESVGIRGDELYFGDPRGKLLKLKDGKVTTVAELGFPCEYVDRKTCSYPIALRFDPKSGNLVFTDIYGGLIQVNVDTGKVDKLIARHERIEGDPVGFPEDLDISQDGTIYWSDGTTTGTIETMWNEFLGHPSGRLMKFEPSKNKSTVLLRNIQFANGVQLSRNEDFILVGETAQFRLIKYYLKGEKKGQSEVFVDGLPGFPDNIRSNNKGGFYVTLIQPRLPIALEGNPNIRKFLARTMFLLDYITKSLYNIFPTEFTKTLNKLIVSVTELKIESGNGFIVELNEEGKIIGSLQSTNGILYGVSQITMGEKYTYFTSPVNTKIWYMNTKDLK